MPPTLGPGTLVDGAIVKAGENLGVATPLNRAMWQLIKGLEKSWEEEEEAKSNHG